MLHAPVMTSAPEPIATGSQPHVTDFCRAIAGRSDAVRVITADNNSFERPWSPELEFEPFAVYLASRGLFRTIVLDLDDKCGTGQADFDARLASAVLSAASIPVAVTESGSSGGRHVLFTIQGRGLPASLARRLIDAFGDFGLATLDKTPMTNPWTGAIRPPLALHRAGGRSEVMGDPHAALRRLQQGTSVNSVVSVIRALEFASGRTRIDLPASATLAGRLDKEPGLPPRYRSNSEALMAFAMHLRSRGLDESTFRRRVASASPKSPIHLAVAHRRPYELDRLLRTTWNKACTRVEDSPSRPAVRDDASTIRSWRERVSREVHGPTVKACAEAIGELASSHGRVLVGISVRDLGDRAGCHRSTAHRSLDTLVADEWLARVSVPTRTSAGRYRLTLPVGDVPETVGPSYLLGGRETPTVSAESAAGRLAAELGNDVWRARGLGKAIRETYFLLVRAEAGGVSMTAAEVATAQCVTPRSARRRLNRLHDAGLARVVDGRWSPEFRDPELVATDVGTRGARERQRLLDERDRLVHRARHAMKYLLGDGYSASHLAANIERGSL
jgi:hypothetical protein